jgi:hypothetical protein
LLGQLALDERDHLVCIARLERQAAIHVRFWAVLDALDGQRGLLARRGHEIHAHELRVGVALEQDAERPPFVAQALTGCRQPLDQRIGRNAGQAAHLCGPAELNTQRSTQARPQGRALEQDQIGLGLGARTGDQPQEKRPEQTPHGPILPKN